jgi:hypothetical protein
MLEMIKAGTVLIREGTVLPDALQFESESYSPGWRSIQGLNGLALDRKIHDTGWHFFYFAGETKVSVYGREGQETERRTVKRILASMKFQKFNCLEITRVVAKRFLGMPYTTVSFHPRNVQESMFLLGDETA